MSKIVIFDDIHPEDNAMLQALYSRSPQSVMKHVEKVKEVGSGNFMEKFYVGYGHHSIADCGSTTIFIENVSMLAAKAIQDWPLYSGQEASTRYLDYSQQKIVNPEESGEAAAIQEKWMEFYNQAGESLIEDLKKRYPIKKGENENVYKKAIQARSFDILRGFLPAGTTTFLSWHTNLRQAYDKLTILRHHPLPEIRKIALEILQALMGKYPHSFSHKTYSDQEAYNSLWSDEFTYFLPDNHPEFELESNIDLDGLEKFQEILAKRPAKTNLPNFLGMFGQFTFKFLLDFGSYRDIQRHRNGEILMPLLSTKYGFQQWYLEQLPQEMREKALELIEEQTKRINDLQVSDFEKQYYLAMGFNVPITATFKLPAAIYVAELRSGKNVHPTLRVQAQKMGLALREAVPNLKVHIDEDLDDWDIRRGSQDIIQKTEHEKSIMGVKHDVIQNRDKIKK